MSNPQAPRAAPARLPELDGLRALAILLVLFYHSSGAVPIPWLHQLGAIGWTGVDLFFVLSGFLIGGILLDHHAAPNYYSVFYVRRFFRIVPLYALILLPGLAVLGFGLQHLLAGHSLADQPSTAIWFCPFFLQNIAMALAIGLPRYLIPTWSIAIEEQFYLLLPFVIRRVDRKHLWKILVPAILAAPLLRGALYLAAGSKEGLAWYVLLPCRWDAFFLGVIGALLYRDPAFRLDPANGLRWLRRVWWWSGAASAALLIAHDNPFADPVMIVGYTFIDLFFACTLLFAVLQPASRLSGGLRLSILKPIATISYGIYLISGPMMAVVESGFKAAHISYPPVSWTATLAVSISVTASALTAAVSWKFFESPLLRLGHAWRFQPRPPAGSAS